jgi:hypothetical protein
VRDEKVRDSSWEKSLEKQGDKQTMQPFTGSEVHGSKVHGFIWFLKSILEAFYERSAGFVILNLKPGTSLAIMRQKQHLSRELWVFNFAVVFNPERGTLNL